MSGFESFSNDMIRWLQKFQGKGWLSDISPQDLDTYKLALARNLVNTSAPYQLTRKGRRVLRRFSDPDPPPH